MTCKCIAQTNQQQNGEKLQGSGILQRAAVRSVSDAEVQSTDDKEVQPLSNLAFSKDFSRVPISTTKLPQIMAKLMIGAVGDKYEQEADRVAAQVVKQINAPTSAPSTLGQSVQRQDAAEEELQTKPSISVLQRSPLPTQVQLEAKLDDGLQAKSILQDWDGRGGRKASTDLESAINSAMGTGKPLDAGLRQSMGQAMGADFSSVKVHTDTLADQLNQSIQAKAFTTGQDVFFRQGAYKPGSRGGQELIAHELTHVVQQSGEKVQQSPFPNLPVVERAKAGILNQIQKWPDPYEGSGEANLGRVNFSPKGKQKAWNGSKPSFGDPIKNVVWSTYRGGKEVGVATGIGTAGFMPMLRESGQLDHEPSWDSRKANILQYAKELTNRSRTNSLTDKDIRLINLSYFIKVTKLTGSKPKTRTSKHIVKKTEYVATAYGATMYYNDVPSLKPASGGVNASAGAAGVASPGIQDTMLEALRKDAMLREVGGVMQEFIKRVNRAGGGTRLKMNRSIENMIAELKKIKEQNLTII